MQNVKFKRDIELEIEVHEIINVETALKDIENIYFSYNDVYLDDYELNDLLEKVKQKINVDVDDDTLIEYIKRAYANVLTIEYQDRAFDFTISMIENAINSVNLCFSYEFTKVCFDEIILKVKANRKELRKSIMESWINEGWIGEEEVKKAYYEEFGVMEDEYYNLCGYLENEIINAIKKLDYILQYFDERGTEAYVRDLDSVVEEAVYLIETELAQNITS